MKVRYTEIKGTLKKLAALARKLGFPYRPGDRVFRRTDKDGSSISAYRTLRPAKKKAPARRTRLKAA